MSILSLVLFIVFSSYVISTLVDLLFTSHQQESFKKSLEAFQSQVLKEPPEWLVLYPFYRTSEYLDNLFGHKLFSWKIFISISIFSILLAISSILFLNIIQKDENAKELAPWRMFSKSLEEIPDKVEDGVGNKKEMSKEVKEILNERYKFLKSLNTPGWKIAYTIVYILLCSTIAGFLGVLSVTITRIFLREIIQAKGALTLLGCLLLNLILLFIVSLFFISVITVFSMPILWAGYDILILIPYAGIFWGSLISFIILALLSIFGWFLFISGWIKVIFLISLIPWALLIILLIVGIICYVFKRPVHFGISKFIKKSLESRIGPIGFIAAIFGLLTTLIGYLAN